MDICVYNQQSDDGIAAAAVCYEVNKNVDLRPVAFGAKVEGVDFTDKIVVIAGVTLHEETMEALKAARFVFQFIATKVQSASMQAYLQFMNGEPPLYLTLIQKQVLFQIDDDVKQFTAGFRDLPRHVGLISKLDVQLVKQHGAKVLAEIRVKVDAYKALAQKRVYNDIPCMVVEAPTQFCNDIAIELCNENADIEFAATYVKNADGKYAYSLRSTRGFDVSAFSKHFGGGGKPAAAGFTSDYLIFL